MCSPLPTLERLTREYGDVVGVDGLGGPMFLLVHPSAVEHVLLRHADNYLKTAGSQAGRRLFGGALQLSNGNDVKRMRGLLAPALAFDHLVSNHAAMVVEETDAFLENLTPGPRPGFTQALMDMLLPILVRMYFGTSGDETRELGQLYSEAIAQLPDEVSGFNAGDQGESFAEAVDRLDMTIGALLQSRLKVDLGSRDFASQYLRLGLTAREVRDELVTMMAASYRTVGMALVQTVRLIAEHPDVEAAVVAEATGLTDGAPDPRRLTVTSRVVKESLRLCPPAGLLTRRAVSDDVIQGWRIPSGARVFLSPWVTQRDARFFPDPLAFVPDRWSHNAERQVGSAYFPFGVGGRSCIGSVMSGLILQLVISRLFRRFRLDVKFTGRDRDTWPILMADGGLQAIIHARTATANV